MSPRLANSESLQATLAILRARFGDLSGNLPHPSVAGFMALLEYSSRHGVSPALAQGLRNLLAADLPWSNFLAFLEVIEQENAARNQVLYKTALITAGSLQETGIPVIFLKGAAVLLESRNNAAWRTNVDLDILVSPENVERAADVLIASGCRKDADLMGFDLGLHHHYAPIYHEPTGTIIELHVRLIKDPRKSLLPMDDLFSQSVALNINGQKILIPCPEHRMIHLIAHAQISNWGYVLRQIRLKDVLDVAELGAAHEVDWAAVRRAFSSMKAAKALDGFLCAAHELLGLRLPKNAQVDGRAWATAAIRSLNISEQRWKTVLRLFCRYMQLFAQDPARLRIIWKTFRKPQRLRQLLSVNRERLNLPD